jgi:hypothetical protein
MPDDQRVLGDNDAALIFKDGERMADSFVLTIPKMEGTDTVPAHVHAAAAFFHWIVEDVTRIDTILGNYFAALDEFEETQEDNGEDLQSETEEGNRGEGEAPLD